MIPAKLHKLTGADIKAISVKVRESFLDTVRKMQIEDDLSRTLEELYIPIAAILQQRADAQDAPLLVGVNGAQGAGKSTFCHLLQRVLENGFGLRACTLSIDDLYLTRAERQHLAATTHPLLATRGVPGTHDLRFGQSLLKKLRLLKEEPLALPAFDKAMDDRRDETEWPRVTGPLDLILFEGWCVGAAPQPDAMLTQPINCLERDEDPDFRWRQYVNQQLQTDYRELFADIDILLMLKVPDMESVRRWRGLQEQKLAAATSAGQGTQVMHAEALERFIMHYERLTRWILEEMPKRADLVLSLNSNHRVEGFEINRPDLFTQ